MRGDRMKQHGATLAQASSSELTRQREDSAVPAQASSSELTSQCVGGETSDPAHLECFWELSHLLGFSSKRTHKQAGDHHQLVSALV